MNLTCSGLVPFSNLSVNESLKSNISIQLSLQLFSPLIILIQHNIYHLLSKSEDFILSELSNHSNFSNSITIKRGLQSTLLQMLPGYAFIIIGIAIGIAFPIICYKGLCSKNYINISKYQACFCIEGFLYIVACVFLAFGTAGSIQAAVNIDESIQSYTILGRAAADDILTFLETMKIQLDVLRHDLFIVLDYNIQSLADLPWNILNKIRKLLYPLMPFAEIQFLNFFEKLKVDMSNAGITTKNGNANHTLYQAMTEMETKVNGIIRHLSLLKNDILHDSEFTTEEKQMLSHNITVMLKNSSLHFRNIKELNWNNINNIFHYLSYNMLPAANHTVCFMHSIPEKIEISMNSTIQDIKKKRFEIQKWANESLKSFYNFTDSFFPRNVLIKLKKVMCQIDYTFSYLDLSSQHSGFSGRALLILLPGFHSLIVLFVMSIACIIGIHEIRRLYQVTHGEYELRKTSFGAQLLHCGVLLGLTLVWLHILLAGIFYLGSIILSMFCLPVMDSTIFSRYLDDVQVWKNRTWIDSLMQNSVSNYSEGMKVSHILEKCKNYETVYSALNMKKYWDLNHHIRMNSVKLNKSAVLHGVEVGLKKIKPPSNKLLSQISGDLKFVLEDLDLNFIQQVKRELEEFHWLNMTAKAILDLKRNTPEKGKFEYVQDSLLIVIYEIEDIERRTMRHIFNNLSLITGLKENIKKSREHLLKIMPILSTVTSIMENASHLAIQPTINNTIETSNIFVSQFLSHAERSITNDIGKCHILYELFLRVTTAVCRDGLQLWIALWLSVGLISVSMVVSLLLGCRIASYFRGAHETHFNWKHRLEAQKWNEARVLKSDALLFDDKGNS